MINKSNLEKIKEYTEGCPVISMDTLKQFGFHVGDIAYLIETGKLVSLQNGYYEYQNHKKQEEPVLYRLSEQQSNDSKVILNFFIDDKETRIKLDTSDPDWALLDEKSRILEHKKGIVLLKAMSEERRHKMYKLTRGIPFILPFPIGKDSSKKRVVLKYHIEDDMDVKKLIKEGDHAFHQGRFKQSIRAYLKALARLRKMSSYVYAQIGLAYIKTFAKKKAIPYLIVANELYKREGKDRDFTVLIDSLQTNDNENVKSYVRMCEEEFHNDNDNYGLEAIEEMTSFVSSGKTVEEVAQMFSLTEEQINLLLLVLARNAYMNACYSLGDTYLKRVEKSKNKTEQVKQLLDEIRKNKKFYKNRKPEDVKTFLLTK